jgi:hypothetical protein
MSSLDVLCVEWDVRGEVGDAIVELVDCLDCEGLAKVERFP